MATNGVRPGSAISQRHEFQTKSEEAVLLGHTADGESVWLDYDARASHLYVYGVTRTGKSTLIAEIALADIDHPDRHGVCVIDPHGTLIQAILQRIPHNRLDDVILIDPSDPEFSVAFNLFAPVPEPIDLDLYASELSSVFEKIFGVQWQPVADTMRNIAVTLLSRTNARKGVSDSPSEMLPAMDEIPHLLQLDKVVPGDEGKNWFRQERITYRSAFYEGLAEAGLMPTLAFWQGRYDILTPRPKIDAIQRVGERIDRFLTNPMLATTLGQSQNKLDLSDAIEKGKIILVNLPKPKLGEENSNFFGSVFMARLMVAIFKRDVTQGSLRPFHLIIDEFHNFATAALPTLLAESGKFGVDLVLASQTQTDARTTTGKSASPANLFCFEVRGGDQLDLAWEFDTTPPEPLPEYRPAQVPVYDLGPELPPLGRCPADPRRVEECLVQLPSYPWPDSVEIDAELFYEFCNAIQIVAERGWHCPERWIVMPVTQKVSGGFIFEAHYPIPGLIRVTGPDASFICQGAAIRMPEHYDKAVALLPYLLGAEFRGRVSAQREARSKWISERARRRCLPPVVDSDGQPVVKHFARKAGNNSITRSESGSESTNDDVTITSEGYIYSQTESRDAGEYEQVPGRARPRSDMHLEIANELAHLGRYRMMVRLTNEQATERNRIVHTINLGPPTVCDEQLQRVIDRSRADHCRPRAEVDVELRKRYEARQRFVGHKDWSFGDPLPAIPLYEADDAED